MRVCLKLTTSSLRIVAVATEFLPDGYHEMELINNISSLVECFGGVVLVVVLRGLLHDCL